jgi:tetratricopeptide (TPR) repeat protein
VNLMAVANVINWTAEFLWNVNFEFDKSLGLFEKAMELIKRSVEVDQNTRDLKMARLIYRKGGIFYDQGKYDLALSCFQQALEIQEANLKNRQHVDVASGLSNIGVVYSSKGDYDLALKYLEQSLEIQKALFGDRHPDVAQTKNNISDAKRGLANQKRRNQGTKSGKPSKC